MIVAVVQTISKLYFIASIETLIFLKYVINAANAYLLSRHYWYLGLN